MYNLFLACSCLYLLCRHCVVYNYVVFVLFCYLLCRSFFASSGLEFYETWQFPIISRVNIFFLTVYLFPYINVVSVYKHYFLYVVILVLVLLFFRLVVASLKGILVQFNYIVLVSSNLVHFCYGFWLCFLTTLLVILFEKLALPDQLNSAYILDMVRYLVFIITFLIECF